MFQVRSAPAHATHLTSRAHAARHLGHRPHALPSPVLAFRIALIYALPLDSAERARVQPAAELRHYPRAFHALHAFRALRACPHSRQCPSLAAACVTTPPAPAPPGAPCRLSSPPLLPRQGTALSVDNKNIIICAWTGITTAFSSLIVSYAEFADADRKVER